MIIIAACARPFAAAAAQAGYKPAAFDIFNDAGTRCFCSVSAQVKYGPYGFDADELMGRLDSLPPSRVVYGSGLEAQPELLRQITRRHSLLGNPPEVAALAKNPVRFAALLAQLGVTAPETTLQPPADTTGWLVKRAGGSGGVHIRRGGLARPGEYYQREIAGLPVSILFLACGESVRVAGCNEQWTAPESGFPYCYGGAVSHAELPAWAAAQMEAAARKVSAGLGLRGLNSMDFILSEQGLYALEINPRLSATLALYDAPALFRQHVQTCEGGMSADVGAPPTLPRAHKILFAARTLDIADGFNWPEWALDIPAPGSRILPGQPVCSVLADAADAASAKAMVFARARQLEAQLHC